MYTIKVVGGASRCEVLNTDITSEEKTINLMKLLREKGVNIASSCYGEGICKKCLIRLNEQDILSCQKALSDFPELEDDVIIIRVNYL